MNNKMKYIFLLVACVFALSGNAQKFNKKFRTMKAKKRIEYKLSLIHI